MSTTVTPIPTREPQKLAAGDTAQWTRAFSGYDSATWTLHYVLRGISNVYKFDATAQSGAFLVTLESTTTKDWHPGLYFVGAYLADGSGNQVHVPPVFSTMELTPNLAVNPAGADPRSWAARTLAQIEDTIQAIMTRRVAAASVNGQSYTLANISELWMLRERLLSEVRREQAQARLNAGLGASNKIGIRFRPLNPGGAPWVRAPWQ